MTYGSLSRLYVKHRTMLPGDILCNPLEKYLIDKEKKIQVERHDDL